MKYFIFIVLAMVSCGESSSSKSDIDNSDTLKKWMLYGMLESSIDVKNCIAKEYGFEFYPIAGCVVEQKLSDSVDLENLKLERLIKTRYGASWKENFNEKVKILETKFNEAKMILAKYDPFIKRTNYLKDKGYSITTEIKPIDTSYRKLKITLYYFSADEEKRNLINDRMYEIDLSESYITEKGIRNE